MTATVSADSGEEDPDADSVGLPQPSTRRQPSTVLLADRIADLERALAASREPMHCTHPAACVVSSREGTSSCAWCDEVARLTADAPCGHPAAVLESDERGTYCPMCIDAAALANLRLRLAQVSAAADADTETMRGLYDDIEQARDEVARLTADLAERDARLREVPRGR